MNKNIFEEIENKSEVFAILWSLLTLSLFSVY